MLCRVHGFFFFLFFFFNIFLIECIKNVVSLVFILFFFLVGMQTTIYVLGSVSLFTEDAVSDGERNTSKYYVVSKIARCCEKWVAFNSRFSSF